MLWVVGEAALCQGGKIKEIEILLGKFLRTK